MKDDWKEELRLAYTKACDAGYSHKYAFRDALADAYQKGRAEATLAVEQGVLALAEEMNADKCASGQYEHGYWDACNELAAAIRARSAPSPEPTSDVREER